MRVGSNALETMRQGANVCVCVCGWRGGAICSLYRTVHRRSVGKPWQEHPIPSQQSLVLSQEPAGVLFVIHCVCLESAWVRLEDPQPLLPQALWAIAGLTVPHGSEWEAKAQDSFLAPLASPSFTCSCHIPHLTTHFLSLERNWVTAAWRLLIVFEVT